MVHPSFFIEKPTVYITAFRYFEDDIAEKEDARAEAEHGIGETELLRHLQLREAHIHAIDVRRDVREHQDRQDLQREAAKDPVRGGRIV